MKYLCLFCGSSEGNNPIYRTKAAELGAYLARNEMGLVYGGGRAGLMGVAADAVLGFQGEVIGVIPSRMVVKERAHRGLSKLYVVESMNERKHLMTQLSDAFLAMPGGMGTMDELFEVITWNQLDIINKPVGIWNVNGYYDPLLKWMEIAVREGFVSKSRIESIFVEEKLELLIHKLLA